MKLSQLHQEHNLDFVFFPSIVSLPNVNNQEKSAVCPYTLSTPFMFNKSNNKILSPALSMTDGESNFVKSFTRIINIHPSKILRAYREAKKCDRPI